MPLKSILAVYAGDAHGSGGLKMAIHMAQKYDAHLTGIVWHGPSPLEHRFHRYVTKEVRDAIASRKEEIASGVRSDFQSRIEKEKLEGQASFIDLKSDSDFSLATSARGYDITVIGNRASEIGRDQFSVRPDVVALRSGKPVVVVPPTFDPARLGLRALVAWDGKRSAARALGDALHILATKEQVTVLTVGAAPPDEHGDGPLELLARHGIHAERLVRPAAPGGIASTILAACAEVQAGLLIMGAYEHSKFAEDLLGGVTRDILDASDVPILMSH